MIMTAGFPVKSCLKKEKKKMKNKTHYCKFNKFLGLAKNFNKKKNRNSCPPDLFSGSQSLKQIYTTCSDENNVPGTVVC